VCQPPAEIEAHPILAHLDLPSRTAKGPLVFLSLAPMGTETPRPVSRDQAGRLRFDQFSQLGSIESYDLHA
jgi:hypothetical protein